MLRWRRVVTTRPTGMVGIRLEYRSVVSDVGGARLVEPKF